jgi:hypothetical protein
MERVFLKCEVHGLSKDELLKRMSKEQAINLIQKLLRVLEESPNDPEVPASRMRMQQVLEDLNRT